MQPPHSSPCSLAALVACISDSCPGLKGRATMRSAGPPFPQPSRWVPAAAARQWRRRAARVRHDAACRQPRGLARCPARHHAPSRPLLNAMRQLAMDGCAFFFHLSVVVVAVVVVVVVVVFFLSSFFFSFCFCLWMLISFVLPSLRTQEPRCSLLLATFSCCCSMVASCSAACGFVSLSLSSLPFFFNPPPRFII